MSNTQIASRLNSMTGFARADGQAGALRWHWEVRSVNGRGLDVRLRMAPGFEAMEPQAREAIQKRFGRGSFNVTLTTQRDSGATEIRLNEAVLAQVLRAADRIRAVTGAPPPTVEGLLQVRGVLEVGEPEATDLEAVQPPVLASLAEALEGVAQARGAEGTRLAAVIEQQLATIEALTREAAASPARTPDAIGRRLAELVGRLVEARGALDPERLHQEAVMLAQRADIEEELKRLVSHIAAARELLAGREPAGRRLDFLAQEFNREANTLCSKSNDTDITRIGLSLKTVIDQMREQVQNIE